MKTLRKPSKIVYLDFYLLLPYLILCVIGILMVYSASSYQLLDSQLSPAHKAFKQTSYFIFSLVCLAIVYRINLAVLRKPTIIHMLLGLTFLSLILLPVIGTSVGGAKRWINLGILLFQPSELVPFILVLYLALALSKTETVTPFSFKQYRQPIIVSISLMFFVALQPNIAGASMIFILVLILFLTSGLSPWFMSFALIGFVIAKKLGTMLLLSLPTEWLPQKFSYLVTRFEVMQNPFIDPMGKGFQTSNAYYAIHNGGFWGLGLGNSIQKKGFLPEPDTDFIFAICIEELGLIFSLGILFLVFFMVARLLLLGIKTNRLYYSYLYIGCGVLLLLQVSVNVGSLLGYIPMTGLTFPFISYGGSSLLILSLVLGVALNVRASELREKQRSRGESQ
ncbi:MULTISPECIES: FtsW/RodA/SpoVE family cell cycle protein [unclassified Enterococcus]|uniref:FtsW/RodA/SpoVE family cell cycle protein n=1 Tax=unclassified Enterococcus TaxID=2608891 RepID=UPI001CE1B4B8|nr:MULTISPECIES: FtsW/RodA/SpoVE family cell cycle protein [unclassified Enterococcus]MCA5013451.1 FtsW/RodA/SpoVE family cell cycle protein [Enterococcus sp. S23]MCA5016701.1 FtsW/RodA/SpoVE family cell cycle protein [Enterococcus sp. S22(2020)]